MSIGSGPLWKTELCLDMSRRFLRGVAFFFSFGECSVSRSFKFDSMIDLARAFYFYNFTITLGAAILFKILGGSTVEDWSFDTISLFLELTTLFINDDFGRITLVSMLHRDLFDTSVLSNFLRKSGLMLLF